MSVSSTSKGTLDGGPFRCGLHDKEFVTEDIAKWEEHRASENHFMFGKKPCSMCGKMHEFDEEPAGNAVFCDKCKPKLAKLFASSTSTSGGKSKK